MNLCEHRPVNKISGKKQCFFFASCLSTCQACYEYQLLTHTSILPVFLSCNLYCIKTLSYKDYILCQLYQIQYIGYITVDSHRTVSVYKLEDIQTHFLFLS